MSQADLSSSGNLMKPLVIAAMKLARDKNGKKKKAEIKMKQKVSVKVKHG